MSAPFLDRCHPAVRSWFDHRFPGGPTPPQESAWPVIAAGHDVLVASPTGTGKTLTGFLVAIDAAYREHERAVRGESGPPDGSPPQPARNDDPGESSVAPGPSPATTVLEPPGPPAGPARRPRVLYVSPLRALATDVHENVRIPLAGIKQEAERLGLAAPGLTLGVRTGDTSAAERAAMRKLPPDLLVTTPESLYLLLTAPSSRSMLGGVRTVIVDEVHTLARDKRGAHLALSLERLDHLVTADGGRLQRIGLSATQRPLEVMATLLSGCGSGRNPVVVDCGHRRDLDVAIELPQSELEAVASQGQLGEVLDRMTELVRGHRTTLVFVNTRRMSERIAHLLAERLDPDADGDGSLLVAAHHGSLSHARRKLVEDRLRAGDLRALVATASLELGIDVGPVELVCQIGSPRSIATFLQRVGRANHQLEGLPAGRLFPMTRDELVECTALLGAVRSGRLDALHPPVAPLDVLAQQIVAEVSTGEWSEDDLYDVFRSAAPYATLPRADFERVVDLVSSGVPTGRGRRGAHVHRDVVQGKLRGRRGARLTALTSGGAIPETGDYRVVLDPEGSTVGSVHEDFAVEAAIGDVFLLGTHSWRVAKVEVGTVRVHDAGDAAPTVPFWLGEAPSRTAELSEEVGVLRGAVEAHLERGDLRGAGKEVAERTGAGSDAVEQVVAYLAASRAALGRLPTRQRIVIERCFDESEGTQLVLHAPYGGGINRALGLALRKRFCVSFDFELQAAADDDAVLLSLGPQHSFPLSQVPGMVRSHNAREVLSQAILAHPMLRARWRWNCNRALVVPRSRSGKRRPIHLQRMEADDILASAWPALAACQENAEPGPIPIPDHVLVEQTVEDCLHEALDVDGLIALLQDLEERRVEVHLVESVEPSPLAHGILAGRPYTFLDGAPLEERRSRAVGLRRGLPPPGADGLPVPVDELAPLDGPTVAAVMATVHPRPRDADELHDLLLSLLACRPVPQWAGWFAELRAEGRADLVESPAGGGSVPFWRVTERSERARSVHEDDEAAAECVGGHLEVSGPVSVEQLASGLPLPESVLRGSPLAPARVRTALARLEARGSAVRLPDGRWCARHVLVRLHAASRRNRRQRVEPASQADLVRFLFRWQHVGPDSLEGRNGLQVVIEQLQGAEVPAGEWERSVLPARVAGYRPEWLDELCLSGEVVWGRLTPRDDREPVPSKVAPAGAGPPAGVVRRGSATPSRSTPLALVARADLGWLLASVRGDGPLGPPPAGASADIWRTLAERGACFRAELSERAGRLPVEVDEGLWDLVARGLATADAFSAVRTLLSARSRWGGSRVRRNRGRPGRGAGRAIQGSGHGEGRWSLLPGGSPDGPDPVSGRPPLGGTRDPDELAETVAWQLLARWGVVCWELWSREAFRIPWRDVVRALRRLEARGVVLGGRFVAGLSGEQFALPEAAALLGRVRVERPSGEVVELSAADPLNLTGLVLSAPRIPAQRHRRVRYRDGVPLAEAEHA